MTLKTQRPPELLCQDFLCLDDPWLALGLTLGFLAWAVVFYVICWISGAIDQ